MSGPSMSELLGVDAKASVKIVTKEEMEMLWRILAPVQRFGMITADGQEQLWCPGEKCWWTMKDKSI